MAYINMEQDCIMENELIKIADMLDSISKHFLADKIDKLIKNANLQDDAASLSPGWYSYPADNRAPGLPGRFATVGDGYYLVESRDGGLRIKLYIPANYVSSYFAILGRQLQSYEDMWFRYTQRIKTLNDGFDLIQAAKRELDSISRLKVGQRREKMQEIYNAHNIYAVQFGAFVEETRSLPAFYSLLEEAHAHGIRGPHLDYWLNRIGTFGDELAGVAEIEIHPLDMEGAATEASAPDAGLPLQHSAQ